MEMVRVGREGLVEILRDVIQVDGNRWHWYDHQWDIVLVLVMFIAYIACPLFILPLERWSHPRINEAGNGWHQGWDRPSCQQEWSGISEGLCSCKFASLRVRLTFLDLVLVSRIWNERRWVRAGVSTTDPRRRSMSLTPRQCQYSYTTSSWGKTAWPWIRLESPCEGWGGYWDEHGAITMTAKTATDRMCWPTKNIQSPTPPTAEDGSKLPEGASCSLSPPPYWIRILLPLGLLLQDVPYPIKRGLIIIISGLQERLW